MSSFHEPELSVTARRLVAALFLSVGLHLAILGLVGGKGAPVGKGATVLQVTIQSAPAVARSPALTLHVPSSPVPDTVPAPARLPAVPAPAPAAEAASDRPVLRLDVTPLVDMTYYTPRDLDVLPRASAPITPEFPDTAVKAGQHGWVLLTLRLDDSGNVQSAKVKDADPPDVFDQSALDAFRHAHFEPGRKDGRAVQTEMDVRVEYQQDLTTNGVPPPNALK